MSEPAALTFDAAWARTGLGDGDRPDATVRPPEVAVSGRDTLPHLTIGEGAEAEATGGPQLVVRELLGAGGMGTVHVAHQPLLDRDVAIKRPRPGTGPSAAAGLLREARYMGSLEHPNIVPVHALGGDDDALPVLVMKRIEGTPWRTLIREPHHDRWDSWPDEDGPLARHVEILIEVCHAVAFAHGRGIVHRDLKPDNVLVGGHGEVYVLDWGIASRAGEPAPDGLVGTPAYMPPEMARAEAVSPAMDIYLLGACLFEVLAGRPPHPGDTVQEVFDAAFHGIVGELPGEEPELEAICRRALDPEPTARWPSVRALQRSLDRWRRAQGLRQLVEASRAHLETLRAEIDGGDPRAAADALAACRFGFGQALEAEPEPAGAREGLQEALRLGARHALERERLDEAELLVDELSEAGGDAVDLREQLRVARERLAAQRALAQDYDLGVSAVQRGAVLAVIAVGGIAITGWLSLQTEPLDPSGPLRIGLGFMVIIVGTVAVAWPWLRRNAVNRGLAGVLVGGMGLMVVHRGLAWAQDIPPWQTLQADLLILSMFGLTTGLLVTRWATVFGGLCVVGAVGCGLWPEHATGWFGGTTAVGLILAAVNGARTG